MLTIETVTAAQNNDIAAMSEVITEMEPMLRQIASRLGSYAQNEDEFTQVGRIALWEGIGRFSGGTIDNFRAFIYRTVEGSVQEAAREERNSGAAGVDRDAIKVFNSVLKTHANGDLDVAEQLAQTLPPKGRRLSATRAHAARMVWQGQVSLSLPDEDGGTIADALESDYGVPDDLVDASDRGRDQRDRKIKTVRAVLDSMGGKGSYILRATYGIDPVPCLGTGGDADNELAEVLNTKPGTVRVLRNQAHKSFENRYSRVTGMTR